MVEVKWTGRALQDLDEIAEYISKDSQFYAQLTVQRLFEKPVILKKLPFIGRMVPEFGIETIRELISGNYRIIYRVVNENRIDVVSVYHSARLLKELPDDTDENLISK